MNVLVVGGTGPTGKFIVDGILERGHEAVIMHSGQHEVEFSTPVEHIHADVHFQSTLKEALGNRTFDAVIVTYGRLRIIAEEMAGRTGRLIAVTGADEPANIDDCSPGGPPLALSEAYTLREGAQIDELRRRKYEAEQSLFQRHRDGHYNATVLRYAFIYGPHAPGSNDWPLVRRILDGRRHLIIADGGMQLESRVYAANGAHAVLLALDQPEASAGQVYNVADERPLTILQRVQLTAEALRHSWELVSLPYELAKPIHPVCWTKRHHILDITKIKTELGYRDIVPASEAVGLSARWLAEHRPPRGGELETQLADPFDYVAEDAMIEAFLRAREAVVAVGHPDYRPAHVYRHPKRPNEQWQVPERPLKPSV